MAIKKRGGIATAAKGNSPEGIIEAIKQRRGVAALVAIGVITIGRGNFFGAVSKIREFFQRATVPKPAAVVQLQDTVRATSVELKQAFDAVTSGRTPPIPERNFDGVVGLIATIDALDPGNGHVTYYRAFMTRWRDQRPASHDALFWYLERAKDSKLFLPDDNGDARFCFENWLGFCKQRQAFINDVLARDFQRSAKEAKDRELAVAMLKAALGYARTSIALYGGFNDPGQGQPTGLLVESFETQIADAEKASKTGNDKH
jgi:hypothetical protein